MAGIGLKIGDAILPFLKIFIQRPVLSNGTKDLRGSKKKVFWRSFAH
jgi:hypothetical protein